MFGSLDQFPSSESDSDASYNLPNLSASSILINDLTPEEKERIKYFESKKAQIKPNDLKPIIEKVLPPGYELVPAARACVAQATQLFTAELIETARKLSSRHEPLTPDLIMMAFNQLEHIGKIPGRNG